jgi:hypothetical protein
MINVNLNIEEEFYSTFKKLIAGFKKEITINEAYDEKYLTNMIDSAMREKIEGKTEEIVNIDSHIDHLFKK